MIIVLLLATLFLSTSAAAYESPSSVIESQLSRVVSVLGDGEDLGSIDSIIDGYFDFRTMTKYSIGKYWKKATKDERESLSKLIATMTKRTYGIAFREYKGQKIVVVGERLKKTKSKVKVNIVDSSKTVSVEFKLILSDRWRVYDIVIEGASSALNNRKQYYPIIKKQGVAGLIAALEKKLKLR